MIRMDYSWRMKIRLPQSPLENICIFRGRFWGMLLVMKHIAKQWPARFMLRVIHHNWKTRTIIKLLKRNQSKRITLLNIITQPSLKHSPRNLLQCTTSTTLYVLVWINHQRLWRQTWPFGWFFCNESKTLSFSFICLT